MLILKGSSYGGASASLVITTHNAWYKNEGNANSAAHKYDIDFYKDRVLKNTYSLS
jgi:hypothetical protein